MSVLIRGMKMPENCADCNFSTWNGFESVYCDVNAEFIPRKEWEEKRQDWCPLVEVPPHGRLIDADKLRAEFPHPNDWRNPNLAYAHLSGIWATIDCAETIIEAEAEE